MIYNYCSSYIRFLLFKWCEIVFLAFDFRSYLTLFLAVFARLYYFIILNTNKFHPCIYNFAPKIALFILKTACIRQKRWTFGLKVELCAKNKENKCVYETFSDLHWRSDKAILEWAGVDKLRCKHHNIWWCCFGNREIPYYFWEVRNQKRWQDRSLC